MDSGQYLGRIAQRRQDSRDARELRRELQFSLGRLQFVWLTDFKFEKCRLQAIKGGEAALQTFNAPNDDFAGGCRLFDSIRVDCKYRVNVRRGVLPQRRLCVFLPAKSDNGPHDCPLARMSDHGSPRSHCYAAPRDKSAKDNQTLRARRCLQDTDRSFANWIDATTSHCDPPPRWRTDRSKEKEAGIQLSWFQVLVRLPRADLQVSEGASPNAT
jgi:hypothetical protein